MSKPKMNRRDVNQKPQPASLARFIHLKRAWYGASNIAIRTDGLIDDVLIMLYAKDGVTMRGEFCLAWYELGGKISPRLTVHDDAWAALSMMPDLIKAMGDLNGQDVTPEQFCKVLKELAFADVTPEKGTVVNPTHRKLKLATGGGAS